MLCRDKPAPTCHGMSGKPGGGPASQAAPSGVAMSKPRWSQDVTRHSNALDLEENVFTWDDPAAIAQSLKRSAEHSDRRKGTPFQSAMSMLTFYVNRAGDTLPDDRRRTLDQAKDELRKLFGKKARN